MTKSPKPPVSRTALSALNLLWHRTRIVSYPSSGRTWLRMMLADLGARPRFTHGNSRFRSGATPDTVAADLNEHLHRRVLYLLRDPKDTLTSNYNHITRGHHNWQGDFKTFIRVPRYGLERMLAFHSSWLSARHRFKRGFRIETYEDLRSETPQTLSRIADFLGVPSVSPSEIEAAAARNQFENMQQREIAGELNARFTSRNVSDPLARRVRRGKVGGHADDMDAEDLAYCDALLAKYNYAALVAEVMREQEKAS